MGPLSAISRFFQLPAGAAYSSFSSISLSSRIWAVAGLILMGLGTTSAAPLQRRYDGGIAVYQPDFSALKPLVPEFGPFYSPELSCLMQKTLDNGQKFCPNTLFPKELLVHPTVCPVRVDSEIFGAAIPREMEPYVNAAAGLFPVRNRAARHFPENLSAFVFNELGLIGNGNTACEIQNHPQHYTECVETVRTLIKGVMADRSLREAYRTQVLTETAYRTLGCTLGMDGDDGIDRKVSVGINPENHTNYKKALAEMEKAVLGNDCFFNKSPEEIVEFIKKIHGIILNNLPANDAPADFTITPGIYRKRAMLVFKSKNGKKEMIENLRKDGATEKEIRVFQNSFPKLKYGDDFQKKLTQAELKVWKKVLYFAPDHNQVEALMNEFAVRLKEYAQRDIHPVALAAWAHCELGRIHPFTDGNGRLARLFLNTILARGGYEPVIFLDDEAYSKYVNEDEWYPGIFADYLAGVIKKQAKGPQLLSNA